jgi:radical SAM superfamily enzyme YgiQ (UPF0313 family)
MKILLISPTIDKTKRTNKGLMMPQLSLYILKGLTPKRHEVITIEEETEEVNPDQDCDLVGISCMTANSPRAYELAKQFRARNKVVVLGGVHPTILPDEALEFADAVVIGEAEGVWEDLLRDFEAGTLKRRYHNPEPDLSTYVQKDFSNLIQRRLYNLIPVLTTRGCPYHCSFCCVTNIYGKKIRHIPVANIVRDIKESGSKHFMFLDDNIIGQPTYAKELFRAIKPLGIKWVGQASVSILVNDDELIKLAAESGCKALFIGIESVSEEQLKTMHKAIKEIPQLELALKKIRKMGILVHASMIFGFDNDTKKSFDETVDFLIKNKVTTASFNTLTPYPGTETFDQMKNSGRLITTDWKYYDHNTVVFKPLGFSPYELQYLKTKAKKRFYSIRSVIQRSTGNLVSPLIYFFMNLGHMKQVKVEAIRLKELKEELFD